MTNEDEVVELRAAGDASLADVCAAIDRDGAVKHGVAPDLCVLVDETVGADVRVIANPGARRDDGGWMDSRGITRGLKENLDGMGKGQVGICGTQRGERWQRGVSREGDALFDEDCGGACRLEKREVAAIREESELAGFGMLDSCDAADFNAGRAFQAATQFLSNIGKFHGAAPQSVLALRASLAQGKEGSTGDPDYSLNSRD